MIAKAQTILFVDDNPSNFTLLVDQLLEHDFQLMVAKSGESGLKRARLRDPDIILLDVQIRH